MKLIVNGEKYEHSNNGSLKDLLQRLEAPSERVAVLVNDEVVSPAARDSVTLRDGDRIEVLVFAGGG